MVFCENHGRRAPRSQRNVSYAYPDMNLHLTLCVWVANGTCALIAGSGTS